MASAPPAAPPPTAQSLRNAALFYLARYAATRAGLLRVLQRKVDRWARAAEAEADVVAIAKREAAAIVDQLAAAGAVDDAAFATGRVRSLVRAGKSRRAITAHLSSKGVPQSVAADAVPYDPAAELAAALCYARSRRIGPFRDPPDPEQRLRDLGKLARAGFAQAIAQSALDADPAEAEAAVLLLRRS